MIRGLQRGLLPQGRQLDASQNQPRAFPRFANTATPRWRSDFVGSSSSLALTQDGLYTGAPVYIEPGHTLVGMGFNYTGVGSSTARLGLYSWSEVEGPHALLHDSLTEIDTSVTGFASVACSLAVEGWVFPAIAIHGAAGQIICTAAATGIDWIGATTPASGRTTGFVLGGVTGALPAIWGALTDSLRVPVIHVDVRPF